MVQNQWKYFSSKPSYFYLNIICFLENITEFNHFSREPMIPTIRRKLFCIVWFQLWYHHDSGLSDTQYRLCFLDYPKSQPYRSFRDIANPIYKLLVLSSLSSKSFTIHQVSPSADLVKLYLLKRLLCSLAVLSLTKSLLVMKSLQPFLGCWHYFLYSRAVQK